MVARSLDNPEYYLNRSLSWLLFNRRVLEEAEDERNPLLERVKFLAITASNLDEFFEVRVASLLQRVEDEQLQPGPDGLNALDEQAEVARELHRFVADQYSCWHEQLRPMLAAQGAHIFTFADLDEEARESVERYCETDLDPLLTPVTVD